MFIKIIILFMTLLSLLTTNTYAKDTSKSSIVMETTTGRVLYSNNINEKKLIASTTKIMTAILAIEKTNITDKVIVGNEILTMYGTSIYLEVGEEITIKDLLYGLLLRSGNDAAIVLATYVGGTEEQFVKMMNEKAKLIGMENTEFQNSHGLDDNTKNISTAYDMALLSSYASKNEIYRNISKTKKYSTSTKNKSYIWYNRNKLLTMYEPCTGGKNGYTPSAGRTLITTAQKDNLDLTIVTLYDYNEYDTHQYLYNKTFSEYKMYKIINKDNFSISKEIYNNPVYIKESFYYPLTPTEKKNIQTNIVIENKNSDIIGYLDIKLRDKVIGRIDIYKQEQKKENTSFFLKLKNYLLDILKKFILGRQNNLNPGPSVPKPLEM